MSSRLLRLPSIWTLLPTLLVVLLAGFVALKWQGCASSPASLLAPRTVIDEKATLSILRSEALSFLVTRRTVTQLVVEHDESNWAGDWHGVLWATVSWRWGVDLTKLTEQDIRRDGEQIVCRLPEPQLLDFGVEPGSVGFMSKSTAVPKFIDVFRGGYQRSVLENNLKSHAMKFAQDQKLCPTRDEIARQLNDAAGVLLKNAAGVAIRFE